ncbi:hypothetical protein GCM10028804_55540 [Larkinella terrae]
MLFAALGRAGQMQFWGPIPASWSIVLEFVVELARILTILVILGHGNAIAGGRKLAGIFRFRRKQWAKLGRNIRLTFRQQWPVLFWNLLVFSLIAYGFNRFNGLVADQSTLLPFLKMNGIMHESATTMPIVFFLKNLTVIPFTLIFEYGLFRWLTGNRSVVNRLVQTRA